MLKFESKIYKEGFNYVADVPHEICLTFKDNGYVPIKGFIDGKDYKGTLIPRKNNRYVLFINADIRRKIRKGKDDRVSIEITKDAETRELLLPEDAELIFNEDPRLITSFRNMTLTHRKEIIRYISQAKGDESRTYRIRKMMGHIKERVK